MVHRSNNVLIIEDNPGDARLIERMLNEGTAPDRGKPSAFIAEKLDDGLKYFDHRHVDVVLLDLGLPDSTGLDTFIAVHRRAPHTPIIVFTGLRDDETVSRVLRDGAQDYLIKGQFDADRLLRSVRYAIERKRAEEQLRAITRTQRLLLSELDHRVRNNLASLVALIDIGERQYTDVHRFADAMRNRVQTMATVHTLLSHSQWTSIQLEQLIMSLIPAELRTQVTLRGDAVVIPVRQTHALGIVLHEFITNSIKYGALSARSGTLTVEWTCDPAPPDHDTPALAATLNLLWRERGGPAIQPAQPAGVGTKIIDGLVKAELHGTAHLTYPAHGATHHITAHLDPGNGDDKTTANPRTGEDSPQRHRGK